MRRSLSRIALTYAVSMGACDDTTAHPLADAKVDAAAARIDAAAPALDASLAFDGGFVLTVPDPRALYDGSLIAVGVDLSAPREIVRRECLSRRYGDGFVVAAVASCSGVSCAPGIECTRPKDCTSNPHGRCLGFANGHCDYGVVTSPSAERDCVADQECSEHPAGRCIGAIMQTSCQYNNRCETDADCNDGKHCDCTANGDLDCFEVDCRQDSDCPTSQRCLRSNPCNAGPYGDYRCTTPEDECVPYAQDACQCDFNTTKRHWACTARTFCE